MTLTLHQTEKSHTKQLSHPTTQISHQVMSLQILSDLHLEVSNSYDDFEIPVQAPYLALLGDIGNVGKHQTELIGFLNKQLQRFRAVLFVPGNHEAYHSSWEETIEILEQFEQDSAQTQEGGRFVLLNRQSFRIPETNITILGCSLFSAISPENKAAIRARLNDFYNTTDWTTTAHNDFHIRDLSWLNDEVKKYQNCDEELMILTHWSPSIEARAIDAQHKGSPITSAFSTDLSNQPCFLSANVKVWAFGHTHYNCDFQADRPGDKPALRLVTNQYGYYFQQAPGFDRAKVIQL